MVPVAEQPELQQVLSDVQSEQIKSAKRSSFGIGFLTGATFGLAALAAVFFLIVTPKTKVMASELATAKQAAADQQTAITTAIDQVHRLDVQNCQSAAALQPVIGASSGLDDFTVLYEPVPATTAPQWQLLNLVKPGLGTLLSKLTPAAQNQSSWAPHWIIPGRVANVKAISAQPQTLLYINAQTGKVEQP